MLAATAHPFTSSTLVGLAPEEIIVDNFAGGGGASTAKAYGKLTSKQKSPTAPLASWMGSWRFSLSMIPAKLPAPTSWAAMCSESMFSPTSAIRSRSLWRSIRFTNRALERSASMPENASVANVFCGLWTEVLCA